MGWQDQSSPSTTVEKPTGGWQDQSAPLVPPAPDMGMVDGMTKNAPGMRDVTNPLEAFMSGLHMSASALALNKGDAGNLQIPENASTFNKIVGALGQSVGDLPFALLGAAGGSAAGASAGGAAGTAVPVVGNAAGATVGALAGGGAGAMALPQAVRETMLDYYKSSHAGKPMTWSEFSSMLSQSAWNTGKAAVVGFVAGPVAGKVGGVMENVAAPAFVKGAATVTAFAGSATVTQGALDRHVPNAEDFTIAAVTGLGLHAVGSIATSGKLTLTKAGEEVKANTEHNYRETGIPPWQQAHAAKTDEVLNQEILGKDVNDRPNPVTMNATRPTEPEPYKATTPKESPFVVARQMPDGTVQSGKKGDVHFNLLSDEELSAEGSPQGTMGFTDQTGKFYTREQAAAALGQPGRLESMRSQGQAQEGFGRRAAEEKPSGPMDPMQHAEQLMPLVRTLEGSGDKAISPKGAIGRYQIMPGTARQYGFDPAKLSDPVYSANAAKTILADLSRRFNGDTEAILVAYNAGPGRAFRFIRDGRNTDHLPTETRNYLERGGFGGKGGEPPKPPGPPQEPESFAGEPGGNGGGSGGANEVPGANRQDFSKLTVDSLRSRFQDAIGEEPSKPSSGNFMRQWFSELESARAIDKIAQKHGLLDPKTDFNTEDMFRQTYASDDRAQYMILKGNIDPITLDAKEGPSMMSAMEAIKEAGGNLTDFNMYRVALRTVEKAKQGVDTGVFKGGVDEASHIVQMPEMQKYAKANEIMQQWKRGGLEYGRDSGLWTQDRLDAMEAANTSHVSLRRVMGDDAGFAGVVVGRRGFRATNPLRKMEGSDRQIVEPLTADMDNARQIIRMADRNRAIGHVLGMNEVIKDLGLSKLPATEIKAMIAEPGSKVFKPYGMSPEAEKAMGPFAVEAKVRGTDKFVFYRDGVPEVWQAKDPAVAELMRGADSKGEADIVSKILALPAKIQRAGIVSAPDFGLRVALNDQLSAWVLDPLHPAPYITTLRGVMEVFRKGDDFWDLMRRGGLSGAIVEGDMAKHISKAAEDQSLLKKTGALEASWNTVTHPLAFAQMVTEKINHMERLGYYKTALEAGISPNKAAMMGRKAYLDFSEKATGQFANMMSQYVPFFRATMLGGLQVRDAIVKNPAQTLAYVGMGLVLPQIALYALNHEMDKFLPENQRYSSLPQWVRDNYYVTPPIGGTRFKLARAFTIGPMINIPIERFLEATFEKDPHAFDGIFGSVMGSVTPGFIPAAVKPAIEDVANYSFFSGRPLISDNLKGFTADEQYNNSTSEVAKRISAAIGAHTGMGIAEVSPIEIDNLVQGWTGTIGATVLHSLDAPLGKTQDKEWTDLTFVRGFTVQNPRMNTKQITDFYNEAADWNALHRDVSKEVKDGREEQAIKDFGEVGQRASAIAKFQHALNVQRTALKAIEKNDTMNLDEKRQLSNRIYQDAWHVAQMGMKILRGGQPSTEEANGLQDQIQTNVEAANGGR